MRSLVLVKLLSQESNAVNNTFKRVAEVVDHNHVIVRFEDLQGGVAPDETQASGDKDVLTLCRNPPQQFIQVVEEY